MIHIKKLYPTVFEQGYFQVLCTDKRFYATEANNFYKATCIECAKIKLAQLQASGEHLKVIDIKIRFGL